MGITKCNTMDAIRRLESQHPDHSNERKNRIIYSIGKNFYIYCPLVIPDVYWMR